MECPRCMSRILSSRTHTGEAHCTSSMDGFISGPCISPAGPLKCIRPAPTRPVSGTPKQQQKRYPEQRHAQGYFRLESEKPRRDDAGDTAALRGGTTSEIQSGHQDVRPDPEHGRYIPLYGASGFGNSQNYYSWTMQTAAGRLFVGTLDLSNGADLWRFDSAGQRPFGKTALVWAIPETTASARWSHRRTGIRCIAAWPVFESAGQEL